MRSRRARRSPARPTVARPEGPVQVEVEALKAWHPEAMHYVFIAAELGLEHRVWLKSDQPRFRNQYTKTLPSPDHVVSGFVEHVARGDDMAWKVMLNVVLDIMAADPRYYGITDPVTQQACVKCRKVLPISRFRGGRIRCLPCEEEDADVRVQMHEYPLSDGRVRRDQNNGGSE